MRARRRWETARFSVSSSPGGVLPSATETASSGSTSRTDATLSSAVASGPAASAPPGRLGPHPFRTFLDPTRLSGRVDALLGGIAFVVAELVVFAGALLANMSGS